jgi:hypothetical protein
MDEARSADGMDADVDARDQGVSLIEILVAVVLIGTAVLAVIGAVLISITGSKLERDHARAHQWLQSAVGVLQESPRLDCVTRTEEQIRLEYQTIIRSNPIINPPGWADSQLDVVPPVKVWNGDAYIDPRTTAPTPNLCFDGQGFRLQLITIQVQSPDGDIIETVEVVKDG